MKIKKGPWIVTGTKTAYKNPWIEVREDQVIRPDGKPGIFGVVTMKSGVTILPMDNEGNVYLTEEYHYGVERITTEAISGGIDGDEDILEAAKRELKEETGLVAKEWIQFSDLDPFTAVVVSPVALFLAKDLSQHESHLEGTEVIKVIKVPFKKALDMAMTGQISQSASVVVILKTSLHLQTQKS